MEKGRGRASGTPANVDRAHGGEGLCPERDPGHLRKGRTAHVKGQTDTVKSAVCVVTPDSEGCLALRLPIR